MNLVLTDEEIEVIGASLYETIGGCAAIIEESRHTINNLQLVKYPGMPPKGRIAKALDQAKEAIEEASRTQKIARQILNRFPRDNNDT